MNILSIIKRTVKPKVCGNPLILVDPFKITKTTLLSLILLTYHSFAQELSVVEIDMIEEEIHLFKAVASIWAQAQEIESADEASSRWEREESEANDILLNKAEIKAGKYWVNGGWHYKNPPQKPRNIEDLKDSDNDGYDDYTEYKYGTDWNDRSQFPIIRNGNNKRTF